MINGVKDAFVVTRDDNSEIEFIPPRDGLYHYDFTLRVKHRIEIENNCNTNCGRVQKEFYQERNRKSE
jgi:hypothetical protein